MWYGNCQEVSLKLIIYGQSVGSKILAIPIKEIIRRVWYWSMLDERIFVLTKKLVVDKDIACYCVC